MSKPTALGAHIYGGGFSQGISRVFKVMGQLEEGPWGSETFERNFPGVYHPIGKENWELSKFRDVNLVYTNPPCAVWSTIGSGKGYDDPRFQFTRNCIDLGLELRPEVFMLESVCRAWSAGGLFYTMMGEKFMKLGYGVTMFLTNGILHGGVQHRERFHFIAHRGELELQEPVVHSVSSVGDVIGDLMESARFTDQLPIIPNHVVRRPRGIENDVLRLLQQGEGYNRAVERLEETTGKKAGRWRLLAKRLKWDEPCSTIADLSSLFHPLQDRQLTLREGARLCGYPDSFIVHEDPKFTTHDGRQEDLTQAVLPPMGEYLARLAHSTLGNGLAFDEMRIVDWRKIGRKFRGSAEGKGDEIKKEKREERKRFAAQDY